MKKKEYSKPTLMSEAFVPNEYVAVCWSVACTQGKLGSDRMDHSGSCSQAENNVISDADGKITVREHSNEQGWLNCKLINPQTWQEITPGTTITWQTYAAGWPTDNRTWTHTGIAQAEYPGHPLMS